MWRWFVGTVVEARKRMLSKLSRSHGACPVECHSRESLIPVEVTKELIDGVGALSWYEDERRDRENKTKGES